MILDGGICRIYRRESTTQPGRKPSYTPRLYHESYFGELAFETSPRRPTDAREETETAARIRILQNRQIKNQDEVELIHFDETDAKTEHYRITRAWHGRDDDSGTAITDLTLEVAEK